MTLTNNREHSWGKVRHTGTIKNGKLSWSPRTSPENTEGELRSALLIIVNISPPVSLLRMCKALASHTPKRLDPPLLMTIFGQLFMVSEVLLGPQRPPPLSLSE